MERIALKFMMGQRMDKTLIIFLFSDNRDPYVNAITHAVKSEDIRVRKIRFIHVQEAVTDLTNNRAKTIFQDVFRQMTSLSQGKYITFARYGQDGKQLSEESTSTLTINSRIGLYTEAYDLIREYTLSHVPRSDLKKDLKKLIKAEGGNQQCLVDITAAIKSPAIEVFAVCLSLGMSRIYSFELVDRFDPKAPEKSLYHALPNDKFFYTLITDIPLVKESISSLTRKSTLILRVGIAGLVTAILSIGIYFAFGANSPFIQILSILGTVIGIISIVPVVLDNLGKN